MLTATPKSGDLKTGGIAVTYRASPEDMFGACPTTCKLKPSINNGTDRIDWRYFKTILKNPPKQGKAFLYTHFDWRRWHKTAAKYPDVTVNYSADTWKQACKAVQAGVATVLVVPQGTPKVQRYNGVRGVVCPACYSDIQCIDCGGGNPLCARERDYVVLFWAHGASKRKASNPDDDGGCYAGGGNVRLHWDRLSNKPDTDDSEVLSSFVSRLPSGTILRHHVAGDIGKWGYT